MKKVKDNIVSAIKENGYNNAPFLALSFFICLGLFSPFINILFEIKPEVSNFSQHIISNASVNNLDVGKRVSLFYKTLIGLFLLTGIVFVLLKKLTSHTNVASKLLKHVYSISIIGILTFFSGILLYQTDTALFFILVSLLFLFNEIRVNKNNTIILALWPVLISFPFALFSYTFLKTKNFFDKIPVELKVKGYVLTIDFQSIVFIFLLLGFAILCYFIKNQILKKNEANKLLLASLPIVFVPTLVSFLLESLNIANVRFDIVYNHPFLIFGILIFVAFGLFYYLLNSKKAFNKAIISKYFMAFCLLSYVILIAQPWRFMIPDKEFFEAANHGIAVDHFFKYGSIPFIENFDAHMLNQQFFSYIYVFFNGYEPWSHSLYILYFYVLEIIVLYFVFKKTLGDINSFFLILCVPILPVILNEFALAGLFALFVIKLLNNPKIKNFYLFWILGILICLYKLDVGYGALLSGVVVYFIFNKVLNNKFEYKQLVKSAVIVVLPMLLLFILLCLVKSINPISRLQEFLLAAMSDQNWGIVKMGNTSNYLFRVSYYILPLVVTTYAVYIGFKLFFQKEFFQKKLINTKTISAIIFFFFFFFFFIFNAQRGIVFHNFEYGNIIRITSTIPIALLFLTLLFNSKSKLIYFSVVFLGVFLFLNSTNVDFKNRTYSLLTKSINSGSFHEKFSEMTAFNGTRLKVTFDQSEINFFKNFLDKSLSKNETYYDFSSTNFYHVLTNRKNPVYVNQSPLMLNGDKAQDFEINYLKEKNVSIVLMPIKNNYWHAISEVYIDFKYYKISEYIYSNYTPLFRTGSFDVYVLRNKKAYFDAKLKSLGEVASNASVTDFNFLNESSINKSNLVVEKTNNTISLKATGASPFFIGMMDYLRKNNTLKNENLPSKLKFKFIASNPGNIKIYYNLNPTDTFSEERAKEFPITVSGTNEINMDFVKIPSEIMVAVNVQSITPQVFQFVSDSQGSVNKPDKIDYFIGFVPKLWAENSKNEAFNSVKSFNQPVEETTVSIEAKNLNRIKNGVFAFLEIESETDMTATIDLSENNISKATYGFSILAGKHQYAVRVSNGFYWWNSTHPKVTFKSEKVVKLSKFSLVTENGKTAVDYKSNGLTLSNLNDENWKNGCSFSYNMVVLDFSPTKENLLKTCKKIKLKDNRIVTVKGYYVSGNYINITIEEKLQDYIGIIGFPNAIEFVK